MILKVAKADSRALIASRKVLSEEKLRSRQEQQTAESICGKVQCTKNQKLTRDSGRPLVYCTGTTSFELRKGRDEAVSV
jgi:hypothetical protein